MNTNDLIENSEEEYINFIEISSNNIQNNLTYTRSELEQNKTKILKHQKDKLLVLNTLKVYLEIPPILDWVNMNNFRN
jgi:hypothetical protein